MADGALAVAMPEEGLEPPTGGLLLSRGGARTNLHANAAIPLGAAGRDQRDRARRASSTVTPPAGGIQRRSVSISFSRRIGLVM